MNDDKIVEFKQPGNSITRQEVADAIVMGEPITIADGSVLQVTAEGLGFTDLEAAMNMRDWLERALEAAGAERVGGGIGCGQADLDINLEGCRFNVSIRPLS